jgi:hypothetical protein
MRRLIIGLLVGTMVFGIVFAVAASLGVTSNQLGAGSADVNSCDTNGVTTGYDASFLGGTYKVTEVNVTGVNDAACDGHTIGVTLVNSAGTSIGSGTATVTTGTTSYDVVIAAQPAASAVEDVHVVIG